MRAHGIAAFDYGGDRSPITLVAAGTGLMLAVMDHVSARWCLDVDVLTVEQKEKLPAFLEMAGAISHRVLVAGWFSTTSPVPLALAVRRVPRERLVCYVQFHGVGDDPFRDLRTATTLADFLHQAKLSATAR